MTETKRERLNWLRKKERELSRQVQRNEISTEAGDAMANLAGLAKDPKAEKKNKKDRPGII